MKQNKAWSEYTPWNIQVHSSIQELQTTSTSKITEEERWHDFRTPQFTARLENLTFGCTIDKDCTVISGYWQLCSFEIVLTTGNSNPYHKFTWQWTGPGWKCHYTKIKISSQRFEIGLSWDEYSPEWVNLWWRPTDCNFKTCLLFIWKHF